MPVRLGVGLSPARRPVVVGVGGAWVAPRAPRGCTVQTMRPGAAWGGAAGLILRTRALVAGDRGWLGTGSR